MSRGTGGVGAGCAGFSLIGLLVAVGLTFWLGAKVFDSTDPAGTRRATDQATDSSVTTTTLPAAADRVAITVDPATGLTDGAAVHVTSTGYPAGTAVSVSTCVVGTGQVTGSSDPCDAASATAATVGADGTLAVDHPVVRLVTIGGTPFDCAETAATCQIVVRPTGANAADPTLVGTAPLTFADDLGQPQITLPD